MLRSFADCSVWASSHCRFTVFRCTRSVRAKASIDESNRCCNPVISKPAAACLRLFSPLSRCSRRRTVFVEQCRQLQFGGVFRKSLDVELDNVTLRKAALNLANVVLESANHDVIERLLRDRARHDRTVADREFQAERKNCWSVRCAALPTETGDARSGGQGRGRLA